MIRDKGVPQGNLPPHGSSFVLIGKMQTLVGGDGMALMAHSNAAQRRMHAAELWLIVAKRRSAHSKGQACDKMEIIHSLRTTHVHPMQRSSTSTSLGALRYVKSRR